MTDERRLQIIEEIVRDLVKAEDAARRDRTLEQWNAVDDALWGVAKLDKDREDAGRWPKC